VKVLANRLEIVQPSIKVGGNPGPETEGSLGFGELLKSAINEVNGLDQQSSDLKAKLVTGEIEDIHQVMIGAEKANLAFQLTVQIRNKVIEAYQEILRMQV